MAIRSILRSPIRSVLRGGIVGDASAPSWVTAGAAWQIDGVNDRAWINRREYLTLDAMIATADADFTRALAAYGQSVAGTLTSFTSGTLRHTDAGMPIEVARTNLVLRSQELDNASWTKSATGTGVAPTVTANAGAAPDGTSTAERVQFDRGAGTTSGDLSRVLQTLTIANATAYASYFYVKSNTGASQDLLIFDESASTATKIIATTSWQRFGVLHTSTTTSGRMQIGLRGDLTAQTADLLIWGAQIEAGAAPTSYIPTTTTSVQRPADGLTLFPTAGTYNLTFTFDDNSTQEANGTAISGSGYAVPTNLNRPYIKKIVAVAA